MQKAGEGMGFQVLFEIHVRHRFFGDADFRGFRITPTTETKTMANNYGLIVKKTGTGVKVAIDSKNEAFSTLPPEEQQSCKLRFYLDITDLQFLNYSDLEADFKDQVFYFSNKKGHVEASEIALSMEAAASGADRCRLIGDGFEYQLAESDKEAAFIISDMQDATVTDFPKAENKASKIYASLSSCPPGLYRLKKDGEVVQTMYKDARLFWKPMFGVIEIFVFDEANGVSETLRGKGGSPHTYVLNFAARSTIWRYYIIPKYITPMSLDMNKLEISNGRNGDSIPFLKKGMQRLPDGKEAIVFDSERPIGLQEKAGQKYQLKSEAGKVLIKRLPVPSSNLLHTQTETDQQHFYSEMYVYL